MRHFTRLFKAMIELGYEPKQHTLGMWATVKAAALADKSPAVVQAVAFVDRLIGVVADLPKPGDEEQPELPPAKPTSEAPPAPARDVDILEGNRG